MRSCPKCGGELYGNGYSTVIRCEFTDEEKTDGVEPDANPIYCDYDEINDLSPEQQRVFINAKFGK